jgi:hypothetical protein
VLHLTKRQAIRFPREERAKNASKHSFSLSVYCQSLLSRRFSVYLVDEVSSSFKSYERISGGRNANLEAIFCGNGGQQKRQHNSLKLRPFILRCNYFFFSLFFLLHKVFTFQLENHKIEIFLTNEHNR